MYAHLYCKSGILLKLTGQLNFNQIIHKVNKKQTKTEGTEIEEWQSSIWISYEKEKFS